VHHRVVLEGQQGRRDVENPRGGETMVEEFGVDILPARDVLGWEVRESVREAVEEEME